MTNFNLYTFWIINSDMYLFDLFYEIMNDNSVYKNAIFWGFVCKNWRSFQRNIILHTQSTGIRQPPRSCCCRWCWWWQQLQKNHRRTNRGKATSHNHGQYPINDILCPWSVLMLTNKRDNKIENERMIISCRYTFMSIIMKITLTMKKISFTEVRGSHLKKMCYM